MVDAGPDVERLLPGLARVGVPNTVGRSGQATNVYFLGDDDVTIIDAGSNDAGATVLRALDDLKVQRVQRLILTHAHPDHAGSVPAVASATGAPVWGDSRDLNSTISGVEVVLDRDLRGGDSFEVPGGALEVYETPGHAPGHIALYAPHMRALFAGDLLSGNGTIAVIPPRGSMYDYLASLRRVHVLDIETVYPGHGPVIANGHDRIGEYIAHRERREEAIFDEVVCGHAQISAIVDVLYPDVIPRLRWHAEGTVLAHLLRLAQMNRVRPVDNVIDAPTPERRFEVIQPTG